MHIQLKSKPMIVSFILVLLGCLLLSVVLRVYHQSTQANGIATPSLMNKPLPGANLVDVSGARLEDGVLRKGKVVLVFLATDCPACETEAQFLKTVIDRRKDVRFYGVISFGTANGGKAFQEKFPFRLFFDEEPRLAGELGLYRVPIKVFLEDGIIKKSWKGATTSQEQRVAFESWFENLN